MPKPTLVEEAKQALGITVPVYRVEIDGDKVTFWLYGRTEPVTWQRPEPVEGTKPTKAKPKQTAKPKADTKPKKTTARRTTRKPPVQRAKRSRSTTKKADDT